MSAAPGQDPMAGRLSDNPFDPRAATAAAAGAERSARRFRVALEAMARPAQPRRFADVALPPEEVDGRPRLSPAALTLLETLSDVDAPWWACDACAGPATRARLTFLTGAAAAPTPEAAAFAVALWTELSDATLARLPIGTPDYPDRGATLLLEVAGFDAASPDAFAAIVHGPGLAAPTRLAVQGVDARFWPFVAANRRRFPLGVDVYLCAGEQIVGLPRSIAPIDRS